MHDVGGGQSLEVATETIGTTSGSAYGVVFHWYLCVHDARSRYKLRRTKPVAEHLPSILSSQHRGGTRDVELHNARLPG